MYLYPNSLTRVAALYRNVPWHAPDFRLYLRSLLRIGGWRKFMERADKFFMMIGSEGQEFLIRKGYAFRPIVLNRVNDKGVLIIWGNVDIYDEARQLICRGSDNEIVQYLFHSRQSLTQKKRSLEEAITHLSTLPYKFDMGAYNRVVMDKLPGGRGSVPMSKNGLSPDFSTVDEALYRGERQFANKKIKLTGSRVEDYKLANKLFGLKKTPGGYVWHHLDDWDPITGKCTMQLIKREYHWHAIYGEAVDHIGGVGVWSQFHGIKYKP